MATSRFSSDVIVIFYGAISREENARLQPPTRLSMDFEFQLIRANLNEWLRLWEMKVPEDYKFKADLLKFAQKTESRSGEVIKNEIETLKSIKTQFAHNAKFSMTRVGEKQEMEHYFIREIPRFLKETTRRSIDEFKGELEALSQRIRLGGVH